MSGGVQRGMLLNFQAEQFFVGHDLRAKVFPLSSSPALVLLERSAVGLAGLDRGHDFLVILEGSPEDDWSAR